MNNTYIWYIQWIVYSIISYGHCQGYKKWKTITNFEEATNWNTGRVPCPADRVVFPKAAPPVFIQTNISITELVLPSDGEIVLGDYVSVSFPTKPVHDNSCFGEDVLYNHTEADSWFNVTNWCVISDIDGDCSVTQPLVLDSESIPCQYDSAVFPRSQSFLVGLGSGVDIYLRSLVLGSKYYSTGTFRQFLNSVEGKKQFVRSREGTPTTVNIRGDESCDDITGCICGNDQSPILDKVCEGIKCQDTDCNGPFTPMGSCCPMCGALLELDYMNTFKITSLKNIIERNYLRHSGDQPEYDGVKYIISKTSLDHIQVVLLDDVNGESAGRMGRAFTDYLKKDISTVKRFGISHVKLQTSTPLEAKHNALKSEKKSLGGGAIVGIVIGIAILLLIILLLVLYVIARRSHRSAADYTFKLPSVKSFKKFNRFSMSSDKTEEVNPSIGFQDTVIMSDLVRGFDNPMYAVPAAAAEEKDDDGPYVIDTCDTQTTNNNSNGFTNPLYGEGPIQELVHSDLGITSMLKFNPVFTTEGVENDSEI